MSTTVRLPEAFTLAVRELMELLACTNQDACHVLWDCSFKMGTDRAFWVDLNHAQRFLQARAAIA